MNDPFLRSPLHRTNEKNAEKATERHQFDLVNVEHRLTCPKGRV
ncbi:hypothetical protein [Azospirillum argentinense]